MNKQYFYKVLYYFFFFFISTTVFAQIGGGINPYSTSIYDKNRNKMERQYDRYDLEKFLSQEEIQQLENDSSTTEQKIMLTPEELRKLGVSEEIIEELLQLNTLQDSIGMMQDEMERQALEEKMGEEIDSISLENIQELIDIQKAQLVEKALSLPEPYLYGHEFFRRNALKVLYDQNMEIRPPSHYELGFGDEINVVMWGNIDYNEVFVIDEKGAIQPNLIGKIYLRGIEYEKAKELIRKRFAEKYAMPANQIEVSMTFSRIITANFVGELFNAGSYRFPAITSVFNALVAIDGPNQLGSVRNIFIKRGGKTLKTLDIYEYLTNPDSMQDFFLEENDYIVVPAMGKVAHISGEIRRSHNYELKGNEGLETLIDFAGGLKAEAFTKNINIKRYQNNREVLIDINLDSLRRVNKDFAIQNGDSVFVYRVPVGLRNYVEVTGAVKVPGRYEVRDGDRISDILYKTEGVLDDADLNRAYVIRLKEDQSKLLIPFKPKAVLEDVKTTDNVFVQNLDTIQVLSRKDFRQDFTVKISGAVRKEGEYEFAENLTLKDLLFKAGGMQKEAANNRLEVSRVIKFTDTESGADKQDRIVVKRVEVGTDISIDENAANFELKPYDHVFVRLSPDFEEQQIVKIYGEIVYPGEYPLLSKQERLNSLLERAGGTTNFAFKAGGQLFRTEDSIGYVLLDIEKAAKKSKKAKFNYILADGDSIFIPKVKNVVTLRGAMRHFEVDSALTQISVPYEHRRRAKHYITKYGTGFSRYAKKRRTYVRYPNGEIKQTRNYGLFKTYPRVANGSTVFVDITDRKRNEGVRKERLKNRNWNDAFDSFTSKIATVLTVLVLVQQVRN
ncbi:MAG: SLBB domain-containing protein [Chitinophagales bacterium]